MGRTIKLGPRHKKLKELGYYSEYKGAVAPYDPLIMEPFKSFRAINNSKSPKLGTVVTGGFVIDSIELNCFIWVC